MDVAVVGIGCRFPGADGPDEFWDLLAEGRDAVRPKPTSRLSRASEAAVELGGFVDDLDAFENTHFGISAREAARMDVQQRLALEVSRSALEDAGVPTSRVAGTPTGVFMGVSTYDHGAALLAMRTADAYDGTGSALSIVANRISYWLDAKGPSISVDTACSSSLVAISLACRSLREEETDLALAGGVNAITNPDVASGFASAGLMAEDGRCRPFDWRGGGYVRGEGAGVLVLKPLARAEADRDKVYCVIRGSAVNQDGRSNGLTAPSRFAQEEVLRAAYVRAAVPPDEVHYVEAHGTGTPVGDPIEVAALSSVLGLGREPGRPLRVGSVKSNIGHLEAAAGVAGTIKTALALQRGQLPGTIHFEKANPMLGLDRLPISVQTSLEHWPTPTDARLAGVSSFGFGGTNAHLVLSSTTQVRCGSSENGPRVFPVSASSEEVLERWAGDLAAACGESGWWPDAAAALALREDHWPVRATVVAEGREEAAHALRALAHREADPNAAPVRRMRRRRRVAFVFSGQGSQHPMMGVSLEEAIPAFGEAMRDCSDPEGRPLWSREILQPGTDGVAFVQPAIFAMQLALAAVWRAWGVRPAGVVGHSMGEVAAARVAGCLSSAEAALVICERSRLLEEIAGRGGLLLVELDPDEAKAAGGEKIDVAACNGPRATVLTGPPERLDRLREDLEARGVFARPVPVDVAAHGPQVDPLRPRLRESLASLRPSGGELPFYSTVAAEPIGGEELGPSYWEGNLRSTVRFGETIKRMIADGIDTFVEISPHPVLTRALASLVDPPEGLVVQSLHREQGLRGMLYSLGELYAGGLNVDWDALYPNGAPHLEMPKRERRRQKFPIASMPDRRSRGADPLQDGILGPPGILCSDPRLEIRNLRLDPREDPWLAEHVLDGVACIPAALWTAVVQRAGEPSIAGAVALREVEFERLHRLDEPERVTQLTLRPGEEGARSFSIHSSCRGVSTGHVRGTVTQAGKPPATESPQAILGRCRREIAVDDCYARLAESGLEYGDRLQGLESLVAGEGEALGRIRRGDLGEGGGFPLHPILLDACFHAIAALATEEDELLPVPRAIAEVWSRGAAVEGDLLYAHVRLRSKGPLGLICDLSISDEARALVWKADGFEVRFIRRRETAARAFATDWRPATPVAGSGGTGRWLVLGEGPAVVRIAEALRARGKEVELEEAQGERATWALDRLGSGARYEGVVDGRSLQGGDGLEPEDRIRQTAETGLSLAQSLSRHARDAATPPVLCFLTLGTQSSSGSKESSVAGGALWGLTRTLANETPDVRSLVVDLEHRLHDDSLAGLADSIAEPPAVQIAARGGKLLTPRLVPLETDSLAQAAELAEGTYMITGGLGALGLWSAEWLARRGAGDLQLIGRSDPDPTAVERIEALRGQGVGVDVVQADVSDRHQLARALSLAKRPVRGVVHCAGALADGLVPNLGARELRDAMAGKAVGAWHLHRLLDDRSLDVFVLFSSLAGLVGSPGQAAYAMANTFLDSLAIHRRELGLPGLSIAWGPWEGMGLASDPGDLARLASFGILPLRPDEGGRLLDAALLSGNSQVAAASFGPELRLEGMPAAEELLGELAIAPRPRSTVEADRFVEWLSQAPPPQRARLLERKLTELTAKILRQPPREIDPNAPFQELGFDSLMGIEFCASIERTLGITLSATLVWAHPTIGSLAEELIALLPQDERPLTVAGDPGQGESSDQPVDLAELDDAELNAFVVRELRMLEGDGTGG